MIPNDEVNLIRSKSNIVDIISSYINLEPKGKNYFGICPFHDDHNPSMSVSSEKQIYTCFVCGASGNVFTFVRDYENVSFPEAVKIVGSKIGHNVSYNIKVNKPNQKYFDIMNLSMKYYINNLKTEEGKNAKEYLLKRNITDEVINDFNIGVSFNDNNLTKLLLEKKYTENEIINIGISNKGDNIYDIFRNRIIFPITNEHGDVVAFSGRIYNSNSDNKYVNSKETEIFKKSNILYNYNEAKAETRKNKEIYVVEGFMDVIRMHTIGIKNVVATMGTAFTKEHANLLKKLNSEVILLMDNDNAGLEATVLAGEELLKLKVPTSVVRLSGEKDPDDYIVNLGSEKFNNQLQNKISYFDFKLNYLKQNKDLNKSKDLANYINEVIKELNETDDLILREVTINKLNTDFGVDKNLIYSKLTNAKKEIKIKPVIKKSLPKLTKNKRISEAVLYMMMKDVKYIIKYENNLGYIPDDEYGQIANDILAYFKINKTFNLADFITYEEDSIYYSSVLRIINTYEEKEPEYDEFDEYLIHLHNWTLDQQIDILINNLRLEQDINKKEEINDLIINLKKERENNGQN